MKDLLRNSFYKLIRFVSLLVSWLRKLKIKSAKRKTIAQNLKLKNCFLIILLNLLMKYA